MLILKRCLSSSIAPSGDDFGACSPNRREQCRGTAYIVCKKQTVAGNAVSHLLIF